MDDFERGELERVKGERDELVVYKARLVGLVFYRIV